MKNKFFQILIPLAVLFIVVGSALKIMHWPGAFPIIYSGNGLFLLFIILYLTGNVEAESVPEFFRKSIPSSFFAVGIGISMVGILMKIMHWPFANITVLIGFGILITACLIWMMNSLKKSQGQDNGRNLTGNVEGESAPEFFKKNISTGFFAVGIGVSIVGISFKIMHWPFANVCILIGSAILITACLIWMMNSLKKSAEQGNDQNQK